MCFGKFLLSFPNSTQRAQGRSMLIRCWGARGSLPISSPDSLQFGGDTSCLEVRGEDNTLVIVDAGTGTRRLGERIAAENMADIHWLFTHTHLDHIMGFPFFMPLHDPRSKITIYDHHHPQAHVLELLEKAICPPYFPIHIRDCKAKIRSLEPESNPVSIQAITVDSIPLSHTGPGLGYRFSTRGRSCVFLTDNELDYCHDHGRSYEDYVNFCKDADLLIHDAEHTQAEYAQYRGLGHSTVDHALQLALDAKVKRLGLFHHKCTRKDQEIVNLERYCRRYAHEQSANLECFAVSQYFNIEL